MDADKQADLILCKSLHHCAVNWAECKWRLWHVSPPSEQLLAEYNLKL